MTTTPSRRFGLKRWIVLGLIALGGYLAFGVRGIWTPVSPAVKLPGEPIWPGVPLTNTILATLIADLLLLVMAFGAWRFSRSGKLVPEGFYNFFEVLVEFLWNTTESAAGKWASKRLFGVVGIFPIMATIFLLVFAGNMVKLLPVFETVGYLEEAHGTVKGYEPVHLFGSVYALNGSKEVAHAAEGAAAEGEAAAEGGEGESTAGQELCHSCEVVPFLRGSATDVNFTFSLAVIAVVMVQVIGVWALGLRYLGKFINTGTMISRPFFGVIDFLVGVLELVSEFAKVLSFGFRLFGNIFAGALLLSILSALTAIIVPSMIYTLEIFVGLIQAYVFAMLALVFMSQATISHHVEEHREHAAAA